MCSFVPYLWHWQPWVQSLYPSRPSTKRNVIFAIILIQIFVSPFVFFTKKKKKVTSISSVPPGVNSDRSLTIIKMHGPWSFKLNLNVSSPINLYTLKWLVGLLKYIYHNQILTTRLSMITIYGKFTKFWLSLGLNFKCYFKYSSAVQPSTHPGPLSLPLTKSGNWSRTLIAHVFVAHMIAELDYGLGGHFKGRFVAKNSNTTLEWRQREWMCWHFVGWQAFQHSRRVWQPGVQNQLGELYKKKWQIKLIFFIQVAILLNYLTVHACAVSFIYFLTWWIAVMQMQFLKS